MNVVKLNENDILILQPKRILSLEIINNLNETFESNKIKIILLPSYVDIVGIKHAEKL